MCTTENQAHLATDQAPTTATDQALTIDLAHPATHQAATPTIPVHMERLSMSDTTT